MRTTKDMMLQSQQNAIRLATDSLHFGEEIRNKNLYGEEGQTKSARMVLKRENQDTLSILLETLIQLFENLRFRQSGANISIQQKIWQQEIVRQIKNQINVYQHYHMPGSLQQTFQQLQKEQTFENTEVLEQTIESIRQELKKNADAMIQERTPILNRIGHTLFSVSAQNVVQDFKKIDVHTDMMQSKFDLGHTSVENQQTIHLYPAQTLLSIKNDASFQTKQNQHTFLAYILQRARTEHNTKIIQTIKNAQNMQQHLQYETINTIDLSQTFLRKKDKKSFVKSQIDAIYHTMLQHIWQQQTTTQIFNQLLPFASIHLQTANRKNTFIFYKNRFWMDQNLEAIYAPQHTQVSEYGYDFLVKQIQYRKDQKAQKKQKEIYPEYYNQYQLPVRQIKNAFLQEVTKQYAKQNISFWYDQKKYDTNFVQWKQYIKQKFTQSQLIQSSINQNAFMLQNHLMLPTNLQLYSMIANWLSENNNVYNLWYKQYLIWKQKQNVSQKTNVWTTQYQRLPTYESWNFAISSMQQHEFLQKHTFLSDSYVHQNLVDLIQTIHSVSAFPSVVDSAQQNEIWNIQPIWLQKQFSSVYATKHLWQTAHAIQNIAKMQQQIQLRQMTYAQTQYKKSLESTTNTDIEQNIFLQSQAVTEQVQNNSVHISPPIRYVRPLETKEIKSQYHLQEVFAQNDYDSNTIYETYQIAKEKIDHDRIFYIKNKMPKTTPMVKQENTKIFSLWQSIQQTMLRQQKMLSKYMVFFLQSFSKQLDTAQNQWYVSHARKSQMYFSAENQDFYSTMLAIYHKQYRRWLHWQQIQQNMVHLHQSMMMAKMTFSPIRSLIQNQNDLTLDIQNMMQTQTIFAMPQLQNHTLWQTIWQQNQTTQYHPYNSYNSVIRYPMIQRFISEKRDPQQQQIFWHIAQNLYHASMHGAASESIKTEAAKYYHMQQLQKQENIYANWKNHTQIYLSHFWEQRNYNTMPLLVKNLIQKNLMQKYGLEKSSSEKMFRNRENDRAKDLQQNLLHLPITKQIRESVWAQIQTILQKYHIMYEKSNIYHTLSDHIQSKDWIQQDVVSTKIKRVQSMKSMRSMRSVRLEPQYATIPMPRTDKKNMMEHTEAEHAKPMKNFGIPSLDRWKKEKTQFHIATDFKTKSRQELQKESAVTTKMIQNVITENHQQTEFIHKKEKQSVLHDTEIQQEWEEAVTVRILEKVQTLWKEQKRESVDLQKVQPQNMESMQTVTNVPEQETYTISALELERMYDKIYTRIERTLASERRRMGM